MVREYLIPVVERVFNELEGHINKDSLSQVFLFFVAMVKDNLRQVRILPYQHPHRRVKHLVVEYTPAGNLPVFGLERQNYLDVPGWLFDNTCVPRRPGMALLLRIASFHWLLVMIVWIACNSLSVFSMSMSLSLSLFLSLLLSNFTGCSL